MAYTYSLTVLRFDEESHQTILVDKWITADEAIEYLIPSDELGVVTEEVIEEVVEEAVEPKTIANPQPDQLATRKKVACGLCGGEGHNKKTCPTKKAQEQEPLTSYAQKRQEDATPGPEVNIDGEIKLAFIQGFSMSEVSDMYPMVTMERLAKLKAEARD